MAACLLNERHIAPATYQQLCAVGMRSRQAYRRRRKLSCCLSLLSGSGPCPWHSLRSLLTAVVIGLVAWSLWPTPDVPRVTRLTISQPNAQPLIS